jgi:hypothetical protein
MDIQDKTIDPNYLSGCPYHGDKYLMNIVDDIIKTQNISQFVETGTGYADTLYYMGSNYNIPCISCEVDSIRFDKCTKFTSEKSNIKIYNTDSPSLIISSNINKNVKTMFWLDAHGCFTNSNGEVITIDPIRQELSAIFNDFNNPEILIDDFKNPFFPKNIYAYDILGKNELSIQYIKDLIPSDFNVYVPIYTDYTSKCMPVGSPLVGWCLITKNTYNFDFIRKL